MEEEECCLELCSWCLVREGKKGRDPLSTTLSSSLIHRCLATILSNLCAVLLLYGPSLLISFHRSASPESQHRRS